MFKILLLLRNCLVDGALYHFKESNISVFPNPGLRDIRCNPLRIAHPQTSRILLWIFSLSGQSFQMKCLATWTAWPGFIAWKRINLFKRVYVVASETPLCISVKGCWRRTEMRMLRWIHVDSLKDKKSFETTRKSLDMVCRPITDKLRETRLRCVCIFVLLYKKL